jgi:hypothetical protein
MIDVEPDRAALLVEVEAHIGRDFSVSTLGRRFSALRLRRAWRITKHGPWMWSF